MLGGLSTEATIMFTDIRGFTTITEEYGAQGTVSFLNEYFSLMVECIASEGGMLDKFIGDAIMACFGLPMPHDDDPDRAVRAAIAMMRGCGSGTSSAARSGSRPSTWASASTPTSVVSGNIGSPRRMDYTVIGDGVNLASRLESACKAYSARILVCETTANGLRGTYRMRDIDLVVVKGKTKPVRVFEVLDYHDAGDVPEPDGRGQLLQRGHAALPRRALGQGVRPLRQVPRAPSRATRCRRSISTAAASSRPTRRPASGTASGS